MEFNRARYGARHTFTLSAEYGLAHNLLFQRKYPAAETMLREMLPALAEVRSMREILPICSYCHRIRDDEDVWERVEAYIAKHTNSRFSHGICPTCYSQEQEQELGPLDTR